MSAWVGETKSDNNMAKRLRQRPLLNRLNDNPSELAKKWTPAAVKMPKKNHEMVQPNEEEAIFGKELFLPPLLSVAATECQQEQHTSRWWRFVPQFCVMCMEGKWHGHDSIDHRA